MKQSITKQPTIEQTMTAQSMTANLVRVLVCPPRNAGWDQPDRAAAWRDLGFHHPVDFATAQSQHESLCRLLADAGAEVVALPSSPAFTLDAVYAHDASLPTDQGLILMNPGKSSRAPEARAHAGQPGVSVFGEITAPGTTEAGDIVWLDPRTLLVGH